MSTAVYVLITTFLASAVEAIEMVTIVIGVGALRGHRSAFIGAGMGFLVLAAVIAGLGTALSAIPIGVLRVVVGGLLLVLGLQWYVKGVSRVAARGFAGYRHEDEDVKRGGSRDGIDWTAFVISFKGVLLEGLEVAFIVVTFGASARQLGNAVIGGAAAVIVIWVLGLSIHRSVTRIPRSVLQLIVGVMLTTFGTFWSLEGLGVAWPFGDATILALLGFYAGVALLLIVLERRRALGLAPGA